MMEWKTICHRKKNNKNHKQEQKQELFLTIINLGLKSSFIWDDILIEKENENLIQQIYNNIIVKKINLESSSSLLTKEINVVALIQQNNNNKTLPIIFYGNIKHMIKNIDYVLNDLNDWLMQNLKTSTTMTYLINVSSKLNEPEIIYNDNVKILKNLQNLLKFIRQQLLNFIEDDKICLINIDDNCDLCAIQGIILGYPIIYCMDSKAEDNCLSNQLLINYLVDLYNDDMFILNIYSFTIPKKFENFFKIQINNWFDNLSKIFNENNNNLKLKLKFKNKLQCHPFIL